MMWVSSLVGYTPKFDLVYSNEPLTRRLFTEAGYKVKALRFFERKQYSSTLIREKMLKNEGWEELVPKSVAAFIREIDGINRIQDLTRSDKL
jgi:nicotinamide-nucleotide adenylyltransferase